MAHILRHLRRTSVFNWLYALALFHAFHFFSFHYINSSYLEQYLSQSQVGLMFSLSSALTLIVLASIVVFLSRFGNYYTAIVATGVNFFSSLGLAFVGDTGWLFVFFVLHTIMTPVTLFCFDVFLESYTEDEGTTGSVRGIFLTVTTLAAVFSPVLSGWIVGEPAVLERAYFIGALYLLPVFVLLTARFRTFVDPVYKILSLKNMYRTLQVGKNIRNITAAHFLLRFYFSWMVIFMPIYLHQTIGFSWLEIGVIFFMMLFAYPLIEYPAGKIADTYLGETELLYAGFIITSVSTIALVFLNTPSVWLWGGVLFITRIGCAFIESMTETYFFKQIKGDDTSVLSIFRMLRPLAYTVGPFVGGMLLMHISIEHLWPILGCIMFLGILHTRALVDTK